MSENVTTKSVATETNQEPEEGPNASCRLNTTTEDIASVTEGVSLPTPGPSTRPVATVRPAVVKPERGDVQIVPNSTNGFPAFTLSRSLSYTERIQRISRSLNLPPSSSGDGIQRNSSSSNVPSSSSGDGIQRNSSTSNVPSSSSGDGIQRNSSSSNVPSSSSGAQRSPVTDLEASIQIVNRYVRELLYRSDPRINELLYQAVRDGSSDTVVSLVGRGANVHLRGRNGMTLLHEAARIGSTEMVELLLWLHVDVRAVSRPGGWTALHWAAERGDYQIALALIEAGANPRALNDLGLTPIDYANFNGHQRVFTILDRCSNR